MRRSAALRLGALVLAALTASTSAAAGRSHLYPPTSAGARGLSVEEASERRWRDAHSAAARAKDGAAGFPPGDTPNTAVVPRRRLAAAAAFSSSAAYALECVPRGGALIDEHEEDDDAGFLVAKLRNVVRSILDKFDRSSPVASLLRSFFGLVEGVTGMRVLPREKKKTKKRRSSARSASSTEKKTRKKRAVAAVEESDESEDDEAEAEARRQKKARAAAAAKKKKASAKKKSGGGGGGGGQASAHASKALKSSSPNYRIQRELKEFLANPPPNLKVVVGKNIRVWIIQMIGTEGSIYAGEKYRLRVSFPPDYPTSPPSVYFLPPTPRHEHVYTNGDICLSLLGKDWRPTMTAQSVANSILSILSGAQRKSLPMDNARHAGNKPGGRQDDWIYHDDNC